MKNIFLRSVALLAVVAWFTSCDHTRNDILLEAESFAATGGWVSDNQSMMQMGSPYLMAHGLGIPVADATTTFKATKGGDYRLWVRTRDWCLPFGKSDSPGRFQVLINGEAAAVVFGTEGADWHWQDGGIITLRTGKNSIALHDLTGFNGRCDAICLTADTVAIPPTNDRAELDRLRHRLLHLPAPEELASYDLVVVGGGIAGCCTAITAARLGCKVAFIHNRPVPGGNNSSEVRVGLSGLIAQQPYPRLGDLMDELGGIGHWTRKEALLDTTSLRSRQILHLLNRNPEKAIHNAGPGSNYEDEKKIRLLSAEPNITLMLNTQVISAETRDNTILSVLAKDNTSGREYIIRGTLFADCTGDGNLGYMAGADFRMGREGKAETGEPRAPEQPDSLVMGTSVQWYAVAQDTMSAFPRCPWALQFNDETCQPLTRGDWNWETGLNRNQIEEIEYIRDFALRATFGNWAYLKNDYKNKDRFANKRLEWVAYIGGKRESRRLLGDVILSENDILNNTPYDDATFTTTWGMDLHFPKPIAGMDEEPFLTYCVAPDVKPYAVPYRCLYSRNIGNLFMAGRDISVTHVALGTVRVMRTGGMMGEVVGMAASLCKRHRALPRAVYEQYLDELKQLMTQGIGVSGFPESGIR